MKKALLIVVLMVFAFAGRTQNTIAKIRYEQAEEAFAKNDYVATLSKLDDAEKLLVNTNPKILYLRIMAWKGIIATNNYEFDALTEARKNTAFFIKSYEKNEGIEEKFKEVFLFYEELEKFPKTADEFNWQKDAPKRELEKKKAAANSFIDSLANLYKFKKGLTEEAFRAYNTFSAELVKKKKYTKEYAACFRKQSMSDTEDNYLYNEGPTGMDITNGIVSAFKYVLKKTSADKNNLYEATILFDSYKTRIHELFPADEIVESNIAGTQTITVNSVNSDVLNRFSISLSTPGGFKEKYRMNILQIEFN
jgi:hypothetical protein